MASLFFIQYFYTGILVVALKYRLIILNSTVMSGLFVHMVYLVYCVLHVVLKREVCFPALISRVHGDFTNYLRSLNMKKNPNSKCWPLPKSMSFVPWHTLYIFNFQSRQITSTRLLEFVFYR